MITQALQTQFSNFVAFLTQYCLNYIHQIQIPQFPENKFYRHIFVINHSFYRQNLQDQKKYRTLNAPGIQAVQFILKKIKKRKYCNIYKFLIQSRKLIRQFDLQQSEFKKRVQKLEFNQSEQKIIFQNYSQIFQKVIQMPINKYFSEIQNSQNVFGCINNKKIQISLQKSDDFQKTKQKLKKLYQEMEIKVVRKFIKYFSLWEIYFSQKFYIDDILTIYRRLNATNLLRQEIQNMKKDLKLIQKFPNIIKFKFLRINISEIKTKVEQTIQSNINKLLKASEESMQRLLDFGYEKAMKVKKLNQVTKYTNIAQYITFISLLNKREVEKSIHEIAKNVIVINSNMSLLQDNCYQIKFSTIKQYLQCRQWVKDLRKTSIQNQKKISLDPYTFMKGIKQKKDKIYNKYFKILKDIIELMKVNELTKFNRYSILAQNIDQELEDISNIAKSIGHDQQLLQFDYDAEESLPINIGFDQNKLLKLDLTFFYLQQRFLQKYLQFWTFVGKFKQFLDTQVNSLIFNMDSSNVLRTLRQGQQLIYKIRHGTLNKRFLHLTDEMNKELQPYLKNMYLMHVCLSGRSSYRLLVLKQITKKLAIQVQGQNITLKQFVGWQLSSIIQSQALQIILKIREQQKKKLQILKKISIVIPTLKAFEVKTKLLKGVGNTRQINIVIIQENLFQTVQYLLSVIKDFKQTNQIKDNPTLQQSQQNQLLEVQKKLLIFQKSMIKMKKCQEALPKFYSLFQFLYPNIEQVEGFQYGVSYKKIYQTILLDYYKKSQLISKLSYTTIYNDKVKINYDLALSQLKQFQIKLFNFIIPLLLGLNQNKEEISEQSSLLNLQRVNGQSGSYGTNNYLLMDNYKLFIFQILTNLQNLNEPQIKLVLTKLFQLCKTVEIQLEYDETQNQIYLNLKSVQTLMKDTIQIKKREKLFHVIKIKNKAKQKQERLKTNIHFGLIELIKFVNYSMVRLHKRQTKQYLHLVYETHYNIKSLFQIYFSVQGILLQSILTCLKIVFYLDLSLVWQNKYDLTLFFKYIKSQLDISYQSKEKQNSFYLQQIQNVVNGFKYLVSYLLKNENQYKLKKAILVYFIPRLEFQNSGQWANKNKVWLKQIKQAAEDNFLSYTHQMPLLRQIGVSMLQLNKIDIRQVQKKQIIILSQLFQNFKQETNLKIVCRFPILKYLQVKYDLPFQWQMSNQKIEQDNYHFYKKQYATSLLIYSLYKQKLFITNEEPDTSILGVNFFKTTFYRPKLSLNQIIIVANYQELLIIIKEYNNFRKTLQQKDKTHNIQKPIIYVLFSDLNVEKVKYLPYIQQNCLLLQIKKQNIRYIMSQDPIKLQTDMVKEFSKSSQLVSNLFIYDDSYSSHIISDYKVKKLKFRAQKQQLKNIIWEYHKRNGFIPEVSQLCMNCINFQIFAIDSIQQVKTQVLDIFCYLKKSQIQNSSLQINQNKSDRQKESVQLYILPMAEISIKDFFGYYESQQVSNEIKTQQNKLSKLKYTKGFLQLIIEFCLDQAKISNKYLSNFMINGDNDTQNSDRWFIFDFSMEKKHNIDIYAKLQSFLKKGFYFSDGSFYHIRQLNQNCKLIILVNEQIVNFSTNNGSDLMPYPYLKCHKYFNPIRYYQMNLKTQLKYFTKQTKATVKLFFQKLLKLKIQHNTENQENKSFYLKNLMCKEVMKTLMILFNIHLNQIRKLLISRGYYSEADLSSEQSLLNDFGAVQLRQKSKKQSQSHIRYLQKLQQVQQKLKNQRKKVYSKLNNNESYHKSLKKSTQQNIQSELSYLSSLYISNTTICNKIQNSLLFCLFYTLNLKRQAIKYFLSKTQRFINDNIIDQILKQIGNQFLHHIGIKHTSNQSFYNYYYSVSTDSWSMWHQFNSNQLNLNSCSSSFTTVTLHPNEIIRLNRSAKVSHLKTYYEFMKKYNHQSSPAYSSKGYTNYFAKLFIIYKIPQIIYLKDVNSYPNWTFIRDILNLKNQSKAKLKDSSVIVNQNYACKLKIQNKKVQKLLCNININKFCIYYKIFQTLQQQSFVQWHGFIVNGLKKRQRKWIRPLNFNFITFVISKQQQYLRGQKLVNGAILSNSSHRQSGINMQIIVNQNCTDFMNVLSCIKPQLINNGQAFRQNFINILMIIKVCQNRQLFDRVIRIMNSVNLVKFQNSSNSRYQIYRCNGIILSIKPHSEQLLHEIEEASQWAINIKNKLTDIINYLLKLDQNIQKPDIQQISQFVIKFNKQITEIQLTNKNSDFAEIQFKSNEIQQYTNYQTVYKLKYLLKNLFNRFLYGLKKMLILQFTSIDNILHLQTQYPSKIVRYMLNRPKKYISSAAQEIQQKKSKKTRVKQIVKKQQFNDILDFNKQLYQINKKQSKQFEVFYLNYCKPLLFFQLKQNFLIIKVNGQFTNELVQKYIQAYKIYQLSKQISSKLKQKVFCLKDQAKYSKYINLYEINYQFQSIKEVLVNEYQDFSTKNIKIKFTKTQIQRNQQAKGQLNYIKVQDTCHCRIVIDNIYAAYQNKHFNQSLFNVQGFPYILIFVPQNNNNLIQQNIPFCNEQSVIKNNKNNKYTQKISQIYQKFNIQRVYQSMFCNKYQNVINKIKDHFTNCLQRQIQVSLQQIYIKQAFKKYQQIKSQTYKSETLLSTKQTQSKQTQAGIIKKQKNIIQLKQIITQKEEIQRAEKSSLEKNIKLFQFYIGQNQFKQKNDKIRTIGKKDLQKQIQSDSYCLNEDNLLYVLMFNVLADNNFFPDKMQQILLSNSFSKQIVSIMQLQRRSLVKFVNYGRLTVIIENQDVIYGNFLSQDQLSYLEKLRRNYPNAIQIQSCIDDSNLYSEQKKLSLDQILFSQLEYIQSLKLSIRQKSISKYLVYLFCHKYIKKIAQRKKQSIKANLQKNNDFLNLSRAKYQNQVMQLNQSKDYLQQIKEKINKLKHQLLQYTKNQQTYLKVLQSNICKITNYILTIKLGFSISCNFKFISSKGLFEQLSNKISLAIVISEEGQNVIQNIAEYIVFQLRKNQHHHALSSEQIKFLLFLVNERLDVLQTAKNINNFQDFLELCLSQIMTQMKFKFISHDLKTQNQEWRQKQTNVIQYLKDYCQTQQTFHFYFKNKQTNFGSILQGQLYPQMCNKTRKLLQKLNKINKCLQKQVNVQAQNIQKVNTRFHHHIERFQIKSQKIFQLSKSLLDQKSLNSKATSEIHQFDQVVFNIGEAFLRQVQPSKQQIVEKQSLIQIQSACLKYKKINKKSLSYYLQIAGHIFCKQKSTKTIQQNNSSVFQSIMNKVIKNHYMSRFIYQQATDKFTSEQHLKKQVQILDELLTSKLSVIFIKYSRQLPQILLQKSKKLCAELKIANNFSIQQNDKIYKDEWFYYYIDQLVSMNDLSCFVDIINQTNQKKEAQSNKKVKYIFSVQSLDQQLYGKLQLIQPILKGISTLKNNKNLQMIPFKLKKQSIAQFPYQILLHQSFQNRQLNANQAQSPNSQFGLRKKISFKAVEQLKFSYETILYFFYQIQNISVSQMSYRLISKIIQQSNQYKKSQITPNFHSQQEQNTLKCNASSFKQFHQQNNLANLFQSPKNLIKLRIQQIKKDQDQQSQFLIKDQKDSLKSKIFVSQIHYTISLKQQIEQQIKKTNKSIIQGFLKPKINGSVVQQNANHILSDPYIYVIINQAFRKVVSKIILKRNSKNMPNQPNHKQSQSYLQNSAEVISIRKIYSDIYYYSVMSNTKLSDIFMLLEGSHIIKKKDNVQKKKNLVVNVFEKQKDKSKNDISHQIICKIQVKGCQKYNNLKTIFDKSKEQTLQYQSSDIFVVKFTLSKCSQYYIKQKSVGLNVQYYSAKQYEKKQKQSSNSSQLKQKNQLIQKAQYMTLLPIYSVQNSSSFVGQFQLYTNFKIEPKPQMHILIL